MAEYRRYSDSQNAVATLTILYKVPKMCTYLFYSYCLGTQTPAVLHTDQRVSSYFHGFTLLVFKRKLKFTHFSTKTIFNEKKVNEK